MWPVLWASTAAKAWQGEVLKENKIYASRPCLCCCFSPLICSNRAKCSTMNHMSYLYREDLVPLCILVWRSMWPFYGLWLGKKKKWVLTQLCNLKVKSKQRVWVLTQMSGQITVCEAVDLAVLLCIQTTCISQILLNWPIKLGWCSWEHLVWNTSCVRRMYQFKCSLQNAFSPPRMPSKQPVNGLAFQGKKPFSCLTSQPKRSNFSLVGVCIKSYFG